MVGESSRSLVPPCSNSSSGCSRRFPLSISPCPLLLPLLDHRSRGGCRTLLACRSPLLLGGCKPACFLWFPFHFLSSRLFSSLPPLVTRFFLPAYVCLPPHSFSLSLCSSLFSSCRALLQRLGLLRRRCRATPLPPPSSFTKARLLALSSLFPLSLLVGYRVVVPTPPLLLALLPPLPTSRTSACVSSFLFSASSLPLPPILPPRMRASNRCR